MTENELSREAYKACGYTRVNWGEGDEGDFGWYNAGKRLGDWSNTDAAIAHAKKAGFYLGAISDDTYKGEPVMVMLWHPQKAIRIHGKAPSLGLAIRNAIVKHAQSKEPADAINEKRKQEEAE